MTCLRLHVLSRASCLEYWNYTCNLIRLYTTPILCIGMQDAYEGNAGLRAALKGSQAEGCMSIMTITSALAVLASLACEHFESEIVWRLAVSKPSF